MRPIPPLAGRAPEPEEQERIPPLAGGPVVSGLQAAATNLKQGQFGNPNAESGDAPKAWDDGPTAVRALGAGGEALAHGQLTDPAVIAHQRARAEAESAQELARGQREIDGHLAALDEWRRQQGLLVGVPRVG